MWIYGLAPIPCQVCAGPIESERLALRRVAYVYVTTDTEIARTGVKVIGPTTCQACATAPVVDSDATVADRPTISPRLLLGGPTGVLGADDGTRRASAYAQSFACAAYMRPMPTRLSKLGLVARYGAPIRPLWRPTASVPFSRPTDRGSAYLNTHHPLRAEATAVRALTVTDDDAADAALALAQGYLTPDRQILTHTS